jgi:ubiquinone/menaquinone biosynthesis C-methylase UbiE
MNIFDKDYMKYWQQAVEKSIDGTIIAGPKICAEYVKFLDIKPNQRALDLGCSFGRMFPVLREKTSEVYGVDLDESVVKEAASKYDYKKALVGKAEEVPFADGYFDAVMAWAVFDVVDQNKGFAEANRILKKGGKLLVTGKNARYHEDDRLGFVAERNARIKNFPNRFTDLKLLLEKINEWGFKVEKEFCFARRGDMGLNKTSPEQEITKDKKTYEYLLILEKTEDVEDIPSWRLTYPASLTAETKARQAGHKDLMEFFRYSFEKDP